MVDTPHEPKSRHRLEIKVTASEKDLIARAAAAAGTGISEFVRSAAKRAASEALKSS